MGISTVDVDGFKKRLLERGISKEDIPIIIEETIKGISVNIQPNSFEFEAGTHCKIVMLNKQLETPTDADDVLMSYNWVSEISGIDPMQVKSVRIPELRYDKSDVFSFDVSVWPFKLFK